MWISIGFRALVLTDDPRVIKKNSNKPKPNPPRVELKTMSLVESIFWSMKLLIMSPKMANLAISSIITKTNTEPEEFCC